ncbi:hypothetical protein PoHVEF18_002914 [Penicillium ochrochloron]
MVWSETGFLGSLGVLDFAGGTPVHICSGASATALSVYLSHPLFRSRRSASRTPQHLKLHRPHNSMCQLLALMIIWNAWLAFDAGTTLALNFKSIMTAVVTNICASSGALTWALITYYETGKWSLDSTFMGAIAGLVMITPSAGFIDMATAFFFGIAGAVICRQALRIKFTKLAARWRWILEAAVGFVWSFVGSYALFALIDCVPGFEVLATDSEIVLGMDASQMGESLYEAQWADEEDYYPFSGECRLE